MESVDRFAQALLVRAICVHLLDSLGELLAEFVSQGVRDEHIVTSDAKLAKIKIGEGRDFINGSTEIATLIHDTRRFTTQFQNARGQVFSGS